MLYQILAFNIKNIKKSYKNNEFKTSAPTWNEEFELPDGVHCISDIQDYFEYILKKQGENTAFPSIRIYIYNIENRITFKKKTGYCFELLTPWKITKNENGENVPNLEITEVVLVHCNIFNNNYQRNSRVLYTFVPNKSFGQLLDISHKNFIILKIFDSEFLYIEVWSTDQNSSPLEIEEKMNIILVFS